MAARPAGVRRYPDYVRVLVLGRTEVASSDGCVRPVPGRRNRQLFGLYALHLGRSVADDLVFEALWGDAWPADPSGSLRAYVTRLRRVLDDDGAVSRAQGGYSLVIDPADLDVAVFEQHVSAGRVAGRGGDIPTCLRELRHALDLWRGPPWAPLAGWPPADADVVRCEELHASAQELLAESSMGLGRHAEATEQLTALCERDPFRERYWELLMVALYLSGRQADALRAYQRARDLLVAELGIEPSARLRQLEADVLRQHVEGWTEPTLHRPMAERGPTRERRPSKSPPGLIGRDRESAALDEQLQQVLTGVPLVAAVSGEAGIGKTRLLETFRAWAAGEDRVSDAADRVAGDVGPVDLRQVCLDVPGGHALGVERDDVARQAVQAAFALADRDRVEGPVAVAEGPAGRPCRSRS
jgi:DNA-binding SARP family transcriptional activator